MILPKSATGAVGGLEDALGTDDGLLEPGLLTLQMGERRHRVCADDHGAGPLRVVVAGRGPVADLLGGLAVEVLDPQALAVAGADHDVWAAADLPGAVGDDRGRLTVGVGELELQEYAGDARGAALAAAEPVELDAEGEGLAGRDQVGDVRGLVVALARVAEVAHPVGLLAAEIELGGVAGGQVAAGADDLAVRDLDLGASQGPLVALLGGVGRGARWSSDPARASPVAVAEPGLEGSPRRPPRRQLVAVPGHDPPGVAAAGLELLTGVVDIGLLGGGDLAGVPDDLTGGVAYLDLVGGLHLVGVAVLGKPAEPWGQVGVERSGEVVDIQAGGCAGRGVGGRGTGRCHGRREAGDDQGAGDDRGQAELHGVLRAS